MRTVPTSDLAIPGERTMEATDSAFTGFYRAYDYKCVSSGENITSTNVIGFGITYLEYFLSHCKPIRRHKSMFSHYQKINEQKKLKIFLFENNSASIL